MISIERMTRRQMHEMYRGFTFDPAIFTDMELFERTKRSPYDPLKVDALCDKRMQEHDSIFFAVLLEGRSVIGEVGLRHIDCEKKECELSIHLKDDSVKGFGFGTEAERLAIEYAFNELGMEAVLADTVIKNTRSQHVLDKLGFEFTGEKDGFKLYRLEKGKFYAHRIDR